MTRRVLLDDDPKLAPTVFRDRLDAAVDVTAMPSAERFRDAVREREADAVVTNGRITFTREVLAGLDSLVALGQTSIGVDNVDVAAATDEGITVLRAPDYCVDEVATHAASLLLACVRDVPAQNDRVADGTWDPWAGRELHRLREDTVGLVSFGDIARETAARLRGFGVDVAAYDPYVDAETMAEHGVEKVDAGGLREAADHLSVHAPLTEETRGLVDAAWFDALPERGVVVNTGRGGVVDEADLRAALDAGDIAAAGLDVFADEPPTDSPLPGRDDVVATPHSGWYSEEARREANATVAADLARVFAGETPANDVAPDGW
ncbi:C-terminal binding protein [Halarchaeum sp. CBA1220]|uniref:C-terminal binding protein n=1 Tax=Halarchaeum sp. CBA1220 TaxID=1853682 RepID=UPI000F3A834A|nr:C-terminal binding protein [Halarchaeum sp. CBA1220]QLC34209.1 C-terminal binding protein [Halarchaeum sp. CBA1220]